MAKSNAPSVTSSISETTGSYSSFTEPSRTPQPYSSRGSNYDASLITAFRALLKHSAKIQCLDGSATCEAKICALLNTKILRSLLRVVERAALRHPPWSCQGKCRAAAMAQTQTRLL